MAGSGSVTPALIGQARLVAQEALNSIAAAGGKGFRKRRKQLDDGSWVEAVVIQNGPVPFVKVRIYSETTEGELKQCGILLFSYDAAYDEENSKQNSISCEGTITDIDFDFGKKYWIGKETDETLVSLNWRDLLVFRNAEPLLTLPAGTATPDAVAFAQSDDGFYFIWASINSDKKTVVIRTLVKDEETGEDKAVIMAQGALPAAADWYAKYGAERDIGFSRDGSKLFCVFSAAPPVEGLEYGDWIYENNIKPSDLAGTKPPKGGICFEASVPSQLNSNLSWDTIEELQYIIDNNAVTGGVTYDEETRLETATQNIEYNYTRQLIVGAWYVGNSLHINKHRYIKTGNSGYVAIYDEDGFDTTVDLYSNTQTVLEVDGKTYLYNKEQSTEHRKCKILDSSVIDEGYGSGSGETYTFWFPYCRGRRLLLRGASIRAASDWTGTGGCYSVDPNPVLDPGSTRETTYGTELEIYFDGDLVASYSDFFEGIDDPYYTDGEPTNDPIPKWRGLFYPITQETPKYFYTPTTTYYYLNGWFGLHTAAIIIDEPCTAIWLSFDGWSGAKGTGYFTPYRIFQETHLYVDGTLIDISLLPKSTWVQSANLRFPNRFVPGVGMLSTISCFNKED